MSSVNFDSVLGKSLGAKAPAWASLWASREEMKNTAFFTSLVLLAAVPLILLRGSSSLSWVTPTTILAQSLTAMLWRRLSRPGIAQTRGWPNLSWRMCAGAGALLVLTWFAFYVPQTKHFWGGWDDFGAYSPKLLQFWSDDFDDMQSRPLNGWSYLLGHALAGGRIEGFLWLAAAEAFVSAILLWGILRAVLPDAPAFALGASALYVVNRLDPLKFYPLWAGNLYGLSVTCLLFAAWMLIVSWQRQNRALLVMACLALAFSLAMYEAGYLLAVLPPLFIWMKRRPHTHWRFWIFSWTAVWALMALRFAVFLVTSRSAYQLTQVASGGAGVGALAENFLRHAKALRIYADFDPGALSYWIPGVVVALTATLAIGRLDQDEFKLERRTVSWLLAFAVTGLILAIAPYMHIVGNERTQFFAAPAVAVLVAGLAAAAVGFLPRRIARGAFAVAVGILCGNAAAQSMRVQSEVKDVTFDKTVHVFEQIRAVCPTIGADTLVLLSYEGQSPLGSEYCAYFGSEFWMGGRVAIVGDVAHPYINPVFTKDEIEINWNGAVEARFPYENVVAFRLEQDGTLHCLRQWPTDRFGSYGESRYAPLANMKSDAIPALCYLSYPYWSGPPVDVITQRKGVVFGRGWSALQFADGWIYRELEQDAELVVNAQGKSHATLELDLAPVVQNSEPGKIEVIDASDHVVAAVSLAERKRASFQIPCGSGQVEVFRVRFTASAPAAPGRRGVLRAYCHQEPLEQNPLRSPPEITAGGVRLGKDWYPCETHRGTNLRWLNTDGVIFTGPCDAGQTPALIFDATPGPGMGGRPCQIELVNERGEILAAETVSGGTPLAITLPKDFPEATPLTLRVLGGGGATPGDPRVLNLMVTRCEWQSTAAPSLVQADASEAVSRR